MSKQKRSMGLSWSGLPQPLIERELAEQADMRERGRRLTAWKERCLAATLDGTTAEPIGDGFQSARLVGIPPANETRIVD